MLGDALHTKLLRCVLALSVALCLTAFTEPAEAVEVGTNSDATWGISGTELERSIRLMDEAGVEWVRMSVSWKSVEPHGKGVYNGGYLATVDNAVAKVRGAGMEVLMEVDSVPYWASADPDKRVADDGTRRWNHYWKPSSMRDFGDVMGYLARRYAPQGVHAYEIWNEPNHPYFWPSGPSAESYAAMVKSAGPAVKAADPQSTVLAGSVQQNDWRFLKGMYDHGAEGSFDAVSTHSYPTGDPSRCWEDSSGHRHKDAWCSVAELHDVMRANGDGAKEVWISEFGFSTCDDSAPGCYDHGFTLTQQAEYVAEALRRADDYPFLRAALQYSFRNTFFKHDDPGSWGGNLGLMRTDFTAKPAFEAFKRYATQASAPDAAPEVTLTAPAAGSIFKRSLTMGATASDDRGIDRVEFLVDGNVVGLDRAAPFELAYDVPRKLAYGEHTVAARAVDSAGQRDVDEAQLTRVRTARLSLDVAPARTLGELLETLVTGQVSGVDAGTVRLALQRRTNDGWKTVSSAGAAVGRDGSFAKALTLPLRTGALRIRARYRGTAQYPPSRAVFSAVG